MASRRTILPSRSRFILFISLFIIFYLVIINQFSTAFWKTYKNYQHGYSIKYPRNWTYDEDYKKYPGYNSCVRFKNAPSLQPHRSPITICMDDGKPPSPYPGRSAAFQINGYSGYINNNYEHEYINLINPYGGYVNFSRLLDVVDKGESSNVFNKMSKTLKLFPAPDIYDPSWKDPDAGDISNWKTYRSTSESLSFKYPPTWNVKNEGDQQNDFITLTTPTGFELTFNSRSIHIPDGGCTACEVTSIEEFSIPGYKTVYVMEGAGETGNLVFLTDASIQMGGNFIFKEQVKSKLNPHTRVYSFIGNFYDTSKNFTKHVAVTNSSQFSTKPEVQTAKKIFRTISY